MSIRLYGKLSGSWRNGTPYRPSASLAPIRQFDLAQCPEAGRPDTRKSHRTLTAVGTSVPRLSLDTSNAGWASDSGRSDFDKTGRIEVTVERQSLTRILRRRITAKLVASTKEYSRYARARSQRQASAASKASRRSPKVDKRRTEGGTHRPISATSLEIY